MTCRYNTLEKRFAVFAAILKRVVFYVVENIVVAMDPDYYDEVSV